MVTDQYGAILQELGRAMNLPNLHADNHNTCLLKFKDGTRVYIEPDQENLNMILGSDLGIIPVGRYRENIFEEALKANGMPNPRHGTFAYSKQNDHLVIFHAFPMQDLTGEKIADFLPLFLEKVRLWKNALSHNEVPVITAASNSRPAGMFGMRP